MDTKLNIGAVIRSERQKQSISLDEAARKTGVSKAMLGQIERDESSPTLSTVWKISTGLHIPMATLLAQNKSADYKVTKLSELEPLSENDGNIQVYNIFPFDPVTGIDYLYIKIHPGVNYPSTTHPNAVEEYVVVTTGQLTMHIAGKEYLLETGDSITFAGDEEHAYENRGDSETVFQCVVRY
ncbi:MAG: XRE family transcriptional regulator [Oscillospiraceae bacterium]